MCRDPRLDWAWRQAVGRTHLTAVGIEWSGCHRHSQDACRHGVHYNPQQSDRNRPCTESVTGYLGSWEIGASQQEGAILGWGDPAYLGLQKPVWSCLCAGDAAGRLEGLMRWVLDGNQAEVVRADTGGTAGVAQETKIPPHEKT